MNNLALYIYWAKLTQTLHKSEWHWKFLQSKLEKILYPWKICRVVRNNTSCPISRLTQCIFYHSFVESNREEWINSGISYSLEFCKQRVKYRDSLNRKKNSLTYTILKAIKVISWGVSVPLLYKKYTLKVSQSPKFKETIRPNKIK